MNSAFIDYKKAATAYHEYGSNYSVPLRGSLLSNGERVASAQVRTKTIARFATEQAAQRVRSTLPE